MVMKTRTSCFVDEFYFDQFLVCYKSYKYYGNTRPFRVYNYNKLSQQRIDQLTDLGIEVVDVEQGDMSYKLYILQFAFKWKGLLESDCDRELVIDADTLFLDNVDDVLDNMQQEAAVVPEFNAEGHRVGCLFNIGFLCIDKKFKKNLAVSISIMQHDPERLEMESLCDHVYKNNIPVQELDYTKYMHLWWNHSRIGKNLKVIDGKPIITLDNGERVRFYHFTTHINPFKESVILRLNMDEHTATRMWMKRHNNPVVLIYNYLKTYEDFNTIKETTEEWRIK